MADGQQPFGPPIVAVPAHPGADGQVLMEARGEPGERILPVFSTVPALVAALGRCQPWAVLPAERVRALAEAAKVQWVVLDPEIIPAAWRWQPEDLQGFSWPDSSAGNG